MASMKARIQDAESLLVYLSNIESAVSRICGVVQENQDFFGSPLAGSSAIEAAAMYLENAVRSLAPAPDTYSVGERVAADWTRRDNSAAVGSPDYRPAVILDVNRNYGNPILARFEEGGDTFRFKLNEVRRPAPVAVALKLFEFGTPVEIIDGTERKAVVLSFLPGGEVIIGLPDGHTKRITVHDLRRIN